MTQLFAVWQAQAAKHSRRNKRHLAYRITRMKIPFQFVPVSAINRRAFQASAVVTPKRCFDFYMVDDKTYFNVMNWDRKENTHVYHRLEFALVDNQPLYTVKKVNANSMSQSNSLAIHSFRTIREVIAHLRCVY